MIGMSDDRASAHLRVVFVTPTYVPFVGGASTFVQAMARRLAADGHAATVLTTNAVRVSDFWQPARQPSPLRFEDAPQPSPLRFGDPSQPPSRSFGDAPQPPVLSFGTASQPEGILAAQEVLDGVAVHRLPLLHPWPAPYAFGLLRRAGLWLHLSGLPDSVTHPLLRRLARSMPPLRGLRKASDSCARQADVVHTDDSSWDGMLLAAAAAAASHKKPLVISPFMHLGNAWVRAHYQMAHQVAAYRQAAAVVALSGKEASALTALGVSPQRMHRLCMGVDKLPPELENLDTDGFRQQFAARGPIVAFVGANTFDKGAFTLAQAVLQLNREGIAVDLVCAGPQSELLQRFLRSQPPEEQSIARARIHVLGVVDETTKHRLLAACNLLALPSQVDTFGIVLLEAWQHGKPVIGALAGGIPDLVQHDKTGLLVPFGDADRLAAAVRRLLLEPSLAARLGVEGQSQVQRLYTWDRTYQDLLIIYRGVLNTVGGAA
jgi:glycosyltransferase involved in cell wall biosynthesis